MADRIILHSDLNCFYASVEVNENPKLRDQAIAVCGSTEERHGIVLTASYPAKRRGVKTGMANWQAVRACPGLICVPPHYDLYVKYSRLVRNIYLRYTDKMEPYGMDECWLDVSGSRQLHGDGTAGELYIAKLAVTEANMVSLTVGELVVKGADGHFYSVSVDENGEIVTTLKQVSNDDVADLSIHGTEKLIEGSITAQTLNVQEIFGDNATIRSLIAANIDVDTLFAREATINAINAMDITSNTYLKLMVSGKADQSAVDALGERMDAAELKITEDAIVSTVTGSQQYKDDLASVSVSGSGVEMIVGTQTANTSAWTGVAAFSELKDGLQIAYWLPYSSTGTASLELTMPDGTTTGAIPLYFSQSSRLGTQYPAGNVIRLTYRENAKYFSNTIAQGWWADANYNTDTYDRIKSGSVKAKENISYFRFAVGDDEGYFQLDAGKAFNVNKPVPWTTSTTNAGYTTSNVYLAYSSVYVRYHLSTFTGVQGASLYIAGTLNGATFTPAETYLTCTAPTEEDGLTYLLLGTMTSAYYVTLFPEHPLYRFVDGAFQPLSQVGYQAYAEVGTLRTETQTAIEQTNAAIALKADQTAMDAMSERMDSAELKLQPDQLMSSIRSSSLYRYDRYGGRNYVLNSGWPYKFTGGYYTYASGTVSSYTGLQLSVSDDLFDHSGSGATLRLSFDIKRDSIDATSASTAGVYFGIWVYYRYYASDGTTINTSGRGYYLRTTDTDFAATDDDWVRVTKGPMNITSYSPIGIAYVSIGTAAAAGCTGTVQIRNVKCEVGDSFTDWSAAPEDLNDLPNRMTTAESTISQHSSQIALKVSTSTYNAEKVYRGATAPTTLYTNMLWLDTSVSPNLLKRYTGSAWVVAGAEEVKSSGIYIGPNQVSITTEDFLLQLLDPADNENVLMEMSANGNVGFKELYADEVISDSVASAYAGSRWLWVEPSITTPTSTDFRSLGEAVQTLNNKFLKEDVYIYLPYGVETYEPNGVLIRGITGPGKLVIYGYSDNSILNSYIQVQGCFAHICFQNLYLRESRTLNGSNRQAYLCEVTKCHFVEFSGCTLDANGITYDSVYARSAHVFLYNCGLYNALQGLECYLAQGNMKDCCGSCSWAMVSYASLIIASGTVPAGSRSTGENGLLYATSVTTDYGTAIPTVTPDDTGIMYASTTKSWRGSWRTDTVDVIQGVYSDSGYSSSLSWHRGCMWFSTAQNLLSGCTVKSATLTLHRKTGSGSSSAKSVYLCAITNTSASGTPSIAYNYGSIGTIGRDKQVTFSIPVDAVQGLADGIYGGLCIYETPYDFGSSNWSNAYMRMSGTDTDYEPYIECVFSGSTAVG